MLRNILGRHASSSLCRQNFLSSGIRWFSTRGAGVFVHEKACVIGDVSLGDGCSVWPFAVIRGDVNTIKLGARSNVQDCSVIHTTGKYEHTPGGLGYPTTIGEDVTIGHKALLHGCTVGDRVLVGMGATLMDGVEVADDTIIGAGSLVSPGKKLDAGLWVGRPAQRKRDLTDEERKLIRSNADHYVALKERYLSGEFN
uniref:Gamma carbonic anhydrase n=1 Tax=Chromera velia CCMP2878 TaxID=1169474 RepID=A0A0G4HY58_9ALVE|eukprot:Cvel_9412.t1-p1 / transcript=Cvel_9412.t1 / gene=Cvel_9412 / organism=Chromera_velia_CCMP2878 / gene_product=Protein YrdA, putative / transcript_product=Protein YrdA, putative / location=Cvel_scaffold541:50025-53990(+) / protein_length=197 / sequence_SO=supercontig / SO=protein_coding / is_pseudo=false